MIWPSESTGFLLDLDPVPNKSARPVNPRLKARKRLKCLHMSAPDSSAGLFVGHFLCGVLHLDAVHT